MLGSFCPTCGETRWGWVTAPSAPRSSACPLCDTPLMPERRHPGRAPRVLQHERRNAPVRAGAEPETIASAAA